MTANFVAGGYTATYNGLALGQSAEGWRLSHSFFKRLVTGDGRAQEIQDSVYQGRSQQIAFRLIEALEQGIPLLVEPYSGGVPGGNTVVGVLDVRGAGGVSPTPFTAALVMTAVAGTSAANEGPASITIPFVVISEDFPVEVLYAPDIREIPFQGRAYPDPITGVFYTVT